MQAFHGVQKPYNHVCLLLVIQVANGQATWIKKVKGLGFMVIILLVCLINYEPVLLFSFLLNKTATLVKLSFSLNIIVLSTNIEQT